jgi:DNA repair exonuclease SbcCD ATPase subunit
VLAKDFVSKANDFETKLAANQLTDAEITALDDELCELFKTKHDFVEEDSEEVKKLKHNKDVSDAKAEIAEAETIVQLKTLQTKFKDLPEVLPLIEGKIKKIETADKKKQDDENAQKQAKFISGAKEEIKAAKYESLQSISEKYKEYPELVEIINKRLSDEKPGKGDEELKTKLLSKREWHYKDLEALGIKPTGNDMTIAGVRLQKEMYFNTYSVKR